MEDDSPLVVASTLGPIDRALQSALGISRI